MAEGNADKVRRVFASGPRTMEALFELLDDDVEWDYVGAFPESATYYGPAGVRKFVAQWAGSFDDFGIEAEQVIDGGDHVVIHLHQWGRGKETGAQVENRTWQVFTFREGKIIHCRGYPTRSEALEVAGIDE